MRSKEARRFLLSIPVPDELGAQRRAWSTVRGAYELREPVEWRRRPVRPLLALAAALALLAAALTPPGRAVVGEVRDLIGRETRVKTAQPALFHLPAAGKVLVTSGRGVWLVQQSGSKRLLGRYRDASFSPTGLYVVATRRNELVALDPKRGLRWSLPRPDASSPRWTGSQTDTRIAYLSDGDLRVVAGDGDDDKLLAEDVHPVAPAWQPGTGYVVAVSDGQGRVHVYASETGTLLGRSRRGEPPLQIEWSPSGRRILVVSPRTLRILDERGRLIRVLRAPAGAEHVTAAWRGEGFALLRRFERTGESEIVVVRGGRSVRLFSASGYFRDIAWSPDGEWLLLGWEDLDEWVFIPAAGTGEREAVASISRQFRSEEFPTIEGWCCP